MDPNQHVMNKLFPNADKYPLNSLTPTVVFDEEGSVEIALLAIRESSLSPGEGQGAIKTTLYQKDTQTVGGEDLVFQVSLAENEEGCAETYEAVLPGDRSQIQSDFCRALAKAKQLSLFVSDGQLNLLSFNVYKWDAEEHSSILNNILGVES
ncbi:hypothetical protein [Paenibacillus chitinolyticus]|uniref:hypothetical protein n=1 Tax=Paenibacillus chitinolyticus TaxID=79263 RepID=UPI003D07DDC3